MIFNERDQKFLSMLLAATYKLRNVLNISDTHISYNQSSCRDYYLATVLDQMLGLETIMLTWNENFDVGEEPRDEVVLISVTQAAYDEVQMHRRKNIETLAKLILFQDTNRDEYYRHYILINQYTLYKRALSDFRDFYSTEPNHIKHALKNLETGIQDNSKNILPDLCWFKYNNNTECTFKDILLNAIPKANTYEKVVLGITGQEYS